MSGILRRAGRHVRRRRAGFARSGRRRHTSPMPPMDTDRIPTEPTTDHVPPSVTSLTPGPSQAPTSPAAGRGRRTGVIGSGRRGRVGRDVQRRDRVGSLLVAASGGTAGTTPDPAAPAGPDRVRGHPRGLGHHPPRVRRSRRARRSGAHLGRHRRHDPGGRRHRPHRLHDPRGARAAQRVAERLVRRHRRAHRSDRGGPAADRRRLPGQPGRGGRPRGRRRHHRRRRHGRPPARPSTRSPRSSAARPARRSRSPSSADGTGPERTLDIVRADVPIQPVSWTMVPGHDDGPHPPRPVLQRRRRRDRRRRSRTPRPPGADRVVLDLRGNPGGYVNEAVGIASQFLDERRRLPRAQRPGRRDRPRRVARTAWPPTCRSSSSSTATPPAARRSCPGALQDAGRATIVGETTFGTGTVLGEFELSDGSALRVGTVEWLTPEGRRIWHEGIAPDVAVDLPDDVAAADPGRHPGDDHGRRLGRADRSAAGAGAGARRDARRSPPPAARRRRPRRARSAGRRRLGGSSASGGSSAPRGSPDGGAWPSPGSTMTRSSSSPDSPRTGEPFWTSSCGGGSVRMIC